MCFSLQRRAVFPHPNFKKWSEPVSSLAFQLANVLLATAACNVSTSQLQKVVRDRQFFSNLTCKCASCYSGVQFFESELPKVLRSWCVLYVLSCKCASRHTWLRTRRFSEPAFRPSRPTNHCKNTAIRDFPNISRTCIFFLLTFAQLYLFSCDSTSLLFIF